MIIDCTIEQIDDYMIITDLTNKPKIKNLNIQVFTPNGRVINTKYVFKKVNIFNEDVLGKLDKGKYIFNIGGMQKVINFATK